MEQQKHLNDSASGGRKEYKLKLNRRGGLKITEPHKEILEAKD